MKYFQNILRVAWHTSALRTLHLEFFADTLNFFGCKYFSALLTSDSDWPMIRWNWRELTNKCHLDTSPLLRVAAVLQSPALCSLVRLMSDCLPANPRLHKNYLLENKGFWAWILNFVQSFRQFWCTLAWVLYVFAWISAITLVRPSRNLPTCLSHKKSNWVEIESRVLESLLF